MLSQAVTAAQISVSADSYVKQLTAELLHLFQPESIGDSFRIFYFFLLLKRFVAVRNLSLNTDSQHEWDALDGLPFDYFCCYWLKHDCTKIIWTRYSLFAQYESRAVDNAPVWS